MTNSSKSDLYKIAKTPADAITAVIGAVLYCILIGLFIYQPIAQNDLSGAWIISALFISPCVIFGIMVFLHRGDKKNN